MTKRSVEQTTQIVGERRTDNDQNDDPTNETAFERVKAGSERRTQSSGRRAPRRSGEGRGGWQSSGRGEIKAWNTTEVWSQTGENAIGAGVAAPRASLPSEVAALLRGVRDMCRC